MPNADGTLTREEKEANDRAYKEKGAELSKERQEKDAAYKAERDRIAKGNEKANKKE